MFRTLRSAAFTWVGIIGGTFTLFSNLDTFLDFAKWGAWIARSWGDVVNETVVSLFDHFHLRMESSAGMMVAMAIFVTAIAIGAWLQNEISNEEDWPASLGNAFNRWILIAIVLYLCWPAAILIGPYFDSSRKILAEFPRVSLVVGHLLYVASLIIGLRRWPTAYAFYVAICMVALSYIFGNAALHHASRPNVSEIVSISIALACAIFCGIAVVALAPPRAFVWRLSVIMCGVLTLVALNQISLYDWHLPPPP